MTQKEFAQQIIEYQLDINFYGSEVNKSSIVRDYTLLNMYHNKYEDTKKQLEELEEMYPEHLI